MSEFIEITKKSELINKELSRQIKERRKLSGRSIRELAEEIGLSYPYISQFENNKRGSITLDTLVKLSVAFGTSPSQFLRDIERSIEKQENIKF